MKLTYATGLLISITSLVAACSSDSSSSTPNDGGGAGSPSGTGGSTTGNGGSTSGNGGSTSGNGGSTSGNGGSTSGNGGSTTGNGGTAGTDGGSSAGGHPGAGGASPDAGSPCTAYCALEKDKCGFSGATHQFTTEGECMAACAAYDTSGNDGDPSGNTLQCRMTHLGFIMTDADKTLHCPHTGVNPTAYCIP